MKKIALFLATALLMPAKQTFTLDYHAELNWSPLVEQEKAIVLQDQSNALNRVWDGKLTVDGKTYRSLEMYYHLQKAPAHLHDTLVEQTKGLEGLELNTRMEELRAEYQLELPEQWWERGRFDAMHNGLKAKFATGKPQQDLLLTRNAFLIQGASPEHENEWNKVVNRIWGTMDDGRGSNHVGRILMLVRQEHFDGKSHRYDPEKTFSLPAIEEANFQYNTSLFNGQEKE